MLEIYYHWREGLIPLEHAHGHSQSYSITDDAHYNR